MKLGMFVYGVCTYANNVFKPAVEYISKQPEPTSLSDRQVLTLPNFQQALPEDLRAKLNGKEIRLEVARTFNDNGVCLVACSLYMPDEKLPFVYCDVSPDFIIDGFCNIFDCLERELSK